MNENYFSINLDFENLLTDWMAPRFQNFFVRANRPPTRPVRNREVVVLPHNPFDLVPKPVKIGEFIS
jgi:hypothetical protein